MSLRLAFALVALIACGDGGAASATAGGGAGVHATPEAAEVVRGAWVEIRREPVQTEGTGGDLVQDLVWQGHRVQLYQGGTYAQLVTKVRIETDAVWKDVFSRVNGSFGNLAVGADDRLYHYFVDNAGGHHFEVFTGSSWTSLHEEAPGDMDSHAMLRLGGGLFRFLLPFNGTTFRIDSWSGSTWQPVVAGATGTLPRTFRRMKVSTAEALPNTALISFGLADSNPTETQRFYSFDGTQVTPVFSAAQVTSSVEGYVLGSRGTWFYLRPDESVLHTDIEEITAGAATKRHGSPEGFFYPFGTSDAGELYLIQFRPNAPYAIANGIVSWDGDSFRAYPHPEHDAGFINEYAYHSLKRVGGKLQYTFVTGVLMASIVTYEFRE